MASAIGRKYSYNPQAYSALLQKVHNKVQNNLIRDSLMAEALEIQNILQEIKYVAKKMEQPPIDSVEQELVDEYKDFINEIIAIENAARADSGKARSLKSSALFRRSNNTKTINGVDNIFEEEFAALEAALDKRFGGSGRIYDFLVGSQSADVAAMQDLTEDLKRTIVDSVQETADKLGAKYQAKDLLKGRSQKIDNQGLTIDFEVGFDIDANKLNKLAYYLKDATFTDKQYTRWGHEGLRNLTGLQLHLGNTMLYKAVTGVLSQVYNSTNTQREIFFRGLSILNANDKNHSATPEEVNIHFAHMRFNYELRGTGLLDPNGNSMIAKYIIYNDPDGDTVYVRDTASLIAEEMNKNRLSNLFGNVVLSASRTRSR
jgi:hypothetical protein